MLNPYTEFTLTIYTADGQAYHEQGQRLDNVQDTLDYYFERYRVTSAEIWQDAANPVTVLITEGV